MHHSTKRRLVLGMTTGGLLLTGLGMGVAQADASADGAAAQAPGLLSGNLVQIPVDAPINVCGNGVDVVGILDSVVDNHCGNAEHGPGGASGSGASANGTAQNSPGAGSGNLIQIPINAPVNVCGNSVSGVGIGDRAAGNTCFNGNGNGQGTSGSSANGGSQGSPGAGSGNTVQVPINAPVNVCGNQVSVIGIGDTAAGNSCSNGQEVLPPPPPCGCRPPSTPSSPGTPTKVPPAPGAPTPWHGHTPTGRLAETGSGAENVVAPLSAGMLGGGSLLMRKRIATLRHLTGRRH
jgi:hypothetical protein